MLPAMKANKFAAISFPAPSACVWIFALRKEKERKSDFPGSEETKQLIYVDDGKRDMEANYLFIANLRMIHTTWVKELLICHCPAFEFLFLARKSFAFACPSMRKINKHKSICDETLSTVGRADVRRWCLTANGADANSMPNVISIKHVKNNCKVSNGKRRTGKNYQWNSRLVPISERDEHKRRGNCRNCEQNRANLDFCRSVSKTRENPRQRSISCNALSCANICSKISSDGFLRISLRLTLQNGWFVTNLFPFII